MQRKHAESLLKKTKDDYNRIADDFSRYRAKPWKEADFLFNDHLESGDRVLDLGCGCGQFSEVLRDKNAEYFGVDASKKLIEIAKKKYPKERFQVANALSLPFPDNYFDKVYAIALLHHIPSKELRLQILREIKRVLKKSGFLILTVWNLWQRKKTRNLIFKYGLFKILGKSKLDFKDILMNWEKMKDCYFHCFTKKELRKLTREAGFSDIIKDGEFLVGSSSNLYVIAQK